MSKIFVARSDSKGQIDKKDISMTIVSDQRNKIFDINQISFPRLTPHT